MLKYYLDKEVEKKNTLETDIKKLEERTLSLNQTRNDLFKQLS